MPSPGLVGQHINCSDFIRSTCTDTNSTLLLLPTVLGSQPQPVAHTGPSLEAIWSLTGHCGCVLVRWPPGSRQDDARPQST